ncbi:poly-gamma-glutamate biosynthesis protein PgsC/CapC [Pseudoalteromonas sp.]|uniref:poly-gamma-glutamate biosynthesis protein PgsC/CapC n=1 Tax=Pseudoalteromonas sp. TaxID=53249 RepID=UPI00356162DB
MGNFFELTIFPIGALQSSIITTVWIGVVVVVFLNARLGTTLAGLVVPGYLVPLFFVKPISAGVVLTEALITYIIAYLFGTKLLVKLGYAEMFGRDRFFALILISVLVRIGMDFYFLPEVVLWLGDEYKGFQLENHLQSFGLIIVALIANQMWMGGAIKGIKALTLNLGLTYLIITFLLIPFTNFSVAGLNYMYEDLATSLLSSPKAYIILLTTAFIASRMNLKFGWEFNGILIPALLALQWYQPEKLLFTFVEAIIILIFGKLLLNSPVLKHQNIEGGALILVFFNVGFIYKIILGWIILYYAPSLKITDYYGFGYIVSTLIAVKVFQKNIVYQMTTATVITSMAGIAVASLIGFSLTYLPENKAFNLILKQQKPVIHSNQTALQIYQELRANTTDLSNDPRHISQQQLLIFQQMISQISDLSLTQKREIEVPDTSTFDILYTADNHIAIHVKGIGFFLFNTKPQSQLVIEVPQARQEVSADYLGFALYQRVQAKALFLDLTNFTDSNSNYIFDSHLETGFFHLAHKSVSNKDTLQIRSELKLAQKRKNLQAKNDRFINIINVNRSLPPSLPIQLITESIPNLSFTWPTQAHNPQWQHDGFGFAELKLNGDRINQIISRIQVLQTQNEKYETKSTDSYLIAWLLKNKELVASKGSNSYIKPSNAQLLFLQQDILLPFTKWLEEFKQSGWTLQAEANLAQLNRMAGSLDYQFSRITTINNGKEYLMLEQAAPQTNTQKRKNWASLLINLNATSNAFIQVPNPFYEKSSFEFGIFLFEKLNASYLLLAGSHPLANTDGSSNVTAIGNNKTVFHVTHISLMHEYRQNPLFPIQIRGFSFTPSRPMPKQDILISTWQSINRSQSPELAELTNHLSSLGLSYKFVASDIESGPYYVSNNQQSLYLNFLDNKNFVTLWSSPLTRSHFQASLSTRVEMSHAKLLGLQIHRSELHEHPFSQPQNSDAVDTTLISHLTAYAKTQNLHDLQNAIAAAKPLKLEYLLEQTSLQQFILVKNEFDLTVAAININSLRNDIRTYHSETSIREFIQNRELWLLAHDKQLIKRGL